MKQREIIFNKFGGKCAYCGEELQKGWHVDELLPCRRKYKRVEGHWKEGKLKHSWRDVKNLSEDEMANRGFKWVEERLVADGYEHPERLHIDNQNPACASCNINKHSMDIESFREQIKGFMKHLNEVNTQYKIAKRYGLVKEEAKPVVFYFETVLAVEVGGFKNKNLPLTEPNEKD